MVYTDMIWYTKFHENPAMDSKIIGGTSNRKTVSFTH
jgi:hypothetical protein